MLPPSTQVKSAKAGPKSKSKERKNRAVQPYISANSKVPKAYLQSQLAIVNQNSAAYKVIENLQGSNEISKAGKLTALTHKLAQQDFFNEKLWQKDEQIAGGSADVEATTFINLSQSPEYSSQELQTTAGRKRQIDALNMKKAQSLKRMPLEKQDSASSPQSQTAIQMHNSIALLN